jgi:DNA-binding response OmpR family regulator
VEYIVTALALAGDNGESRLLAGAASYEVTIVDRMLCHRTGSRWSNICAKQRNPTTVLFLTNLGSLDDRVEIDRLTQTARRSCR